MDKSRYFWVLAIVMGLGGCGGDEPPAPPASGSPSAAPSKTATDKAPAVAPAPTPGESKKNEAPPLEPPKTSDSKEAARPVMLTEAELAKIRKLPAAEQDAAIKQAVCPVSGDHLGNMGTPYKITAEGRTFYLCCDGCKDDVSKDPKGVIAKLDKK
jgi:YHS domain-containing protein